MSAVALVETAEVVVVALARSTFGCYLCHYPCHDSSASVVDVVFDVVQGLSVVGTAYATLQNLFVAVPFVVTLAALEGSRGFVRVGLAPQIKASKLALKPLLVVASPCH